MPWRDLAAEGYTGLELWSFVTDTAERVTSIRELLAFIARPGRFVDHPPRRNLQVWDEICRSRRCVALGGLDAHQVGIRVGRFVPLRLMAYRRSFRYLRTHVIPDRPLSGQLDRDRRTVFDALRAGRAYLAMELLAPARGFRFWAEGDPMLEMGDEAPARAGALEIRLPRPARISLLRGGSEIAGACWLGRRRGRGGALSGCRCSG